MRMCTAKSQTPVIQRSNRGKETPMEILSYIQSHWLEWLFGALTALLGLGYKSLSSRLKAEQKKNAAIAEGVQSLLRESIVSNYNKYTDRGYCPIYAKESIKHVYEAYHNLGGNDVATKLYNTLLVMPEEPKEREVHNS